MWSSGGLDDLVNHSCAPNLGLFPMVGAGGGDGDLFLVARREIAAGEELSFDYSTSMVDEPWAMDCACVFFLGGGGAQQRRPRARGACPRPSPARRRWRRISHRRRPPACPPPSRRCGESVCRGKIANFLDCPADVQDGYARAGFLPEHTAVAYLTRGSGKSQGLAALPLDAAAPAARLFAVSPYASAAAKADANSNGDANSARSANDANVNNANNAPVSAV